MGEPGRFFVLAPLWASISFVKLELLVSLLSERQSSSSRMKQSGSQISSNTGYAHPDYAVSLAEFGDPVLLSASGAWVIERTIANTAERDAMGCYPLFACSDWSNLKKDLDGRADQLVSIVAVTDPFGNYTTELLKSAFDDLVVPFKEHFVVDLSAAPQTFVHAHHQRNARRALETVKIESCAHPADCEKDWNELYGNLIARHDIRGIARFSPASFAQQLKVPGAVLLKATREGATIGMTWWFISGSVGYYHLGAYSESGYNLRASFALFWTALELFRDAGLDWLDLGAGAGLDSSGEDGLTRFKRGWTNTTRPAYLCGRIFDRRRYDQIVAARGAKEGNFFPAYRAGEFV